MKIEIKVEGNPVKPIRIFFSNEKDEPLSLAAEYETLIQAKDHNWRIDKRYIVKWNGKRHNKLEFQKILKNETP